MIRILLLSTVLFLMNSCSQAKSQSLDAKNVSQNEWASQVTSLRRSTSFSEDNLDSLEVSLDSESGDDDFLGLLGAEESPESDSFLNSDSSESKKDKSKRLQKKTKKAWSRKQQESNVAQIRVGLNDFLTLKSVRAMVTIEGFRARTVVDHVFHNPNSSSLEGDFRYKLPDNASISYFAYYPVSSTATQKPQDVSLSKLPDIPAAATIYQSSVENLFKQESSIFGEGKVAYAVPKEKALQSYEAVVRRGVDPALVEWAGGNTFTTKVFPISAGGYHRVVIAYEESLFIQNKACTYTFSTPKNINLDFMLVANQKYIENPTCNLGSIEEKEELLTCHIEMKPEEQQTINFGYNLAHSNFIVGKDNAQGITYAYGSISPQFEFDTKKQSNDRAIFVVDTSLSQEKIEFGKYMALLEKILEKNSNIRYFNVLFFDIGASWLEQRWIENNNTGRVLLQNKTQTILLEGATNVAAALDALTQTPWLNQTHIKADIFFLSSGQHNWGEASLKKIVAKFEKESQFSSNFYCYNFKLGTANTELFDLLTQFGGGSFSGYSQVDKLAVAHTKTNYTIKSVSGEGVTDILIGGNARNIYPGQHLLISCKITSSQPVISLSGYVGGAQTDFRFPINIDVQGKLAPRAFGELAVKKMESLEDPKLEDSIIAFSRYFSIPGKTCSLLMLESKADYDTFQVDLSKDSSIIENANVTKLLQDFGKSLAQAVTSRKNAFLYFWKKLQKNTLVPIQPKQVDTLLQQLTEENFATKITKIQHNITDTSNLSSYIEQRKAKDYRVHLKRAEDLYQQEKFSDYLRCLSSIVEVNPYDSSSLRVVGYCLLQKKMADHAISVFKRIRDKRSFEPQSYRDLAKSYLEVGNYALAALHYEIILAGTWDQRFLQLNTLITDEYIRALKQALRRENRNSISPGIKAFLGDRIEALSEKQQTHQGDLTVTITWNTGNTDVDLWVTEPNGELCNYEKKTTSSGGTLLADVTNGYGPERYQLKKAKRGKYKVEVQYYSSNTTRLSDITFVEITVTKRAGFPDEKSYNHYTMLTSSKEKVLIDNVKW